LFIIDRIPQVVWTKKALLFVVVDFPAFDSCFQHISFEAVAVFVNICDISCLSLFFFTIVDVFFTAVISIQLCEYYLSGYASSAWCGILYKRAECN
jgi:hypothetical protein